MKDIEGTLSGLIEQAEEAGLPDRVKKDLQEYIEDYKLLILRMAHKYVRNRVEYDDLVQEGLIGLVLADRDFDPTRSNDFHTYAITRMKGKMYEHCIGNDNPIYVPTHVAKAAAYFKQMRRLLEKEPSVTQGASYIDSVVLTRNHPDEKDLPESAQKKLEAFKSKLQNIASNSDMNYERLAGMAAESLSFMVSDDVLLKFPSPDKETNEVVFNHELGEEIKKILGEKHFLVLSYHISDYTNEDITYKLLEFGYTNREGKRVSRQAVKSILDDALAKLSKNRELRGLFSEFEKEDK